MGTHEKVCVEERKICTWRVWISVEWSRMNQQVERLKGFLAGTSTPLRSLLWVALPNEFEIIYFLIYTIFFISLSNSGRFSVHFPVARTFALRIPLLEVHVRFPSEFRAVATRSPPVGINSFYVIGPALLTSTWLLIVTSNGSGRCLFWDRRSESFSQKRFSPRTDLNAEKQWTPKSLNNERKSPAGRVLPGFSGRDSLAWRRRVRHGRPGPTETALPQDETLSPRKETHVPRTETKDSTTRTPPSDKTGQSGKGRHRVKISLNSTSSYWRITLWSM